VRLSPGSRRVLAALWAALIVALYLARQVPALWEGAGRVLLGR
jgi:hypothetical protein